jgi:MobA/MobL family
MTDGHFRVVRSRRINVSQHARPHLQTHTRSAGHSAVAGAAYRLGLRLYDEQTKQWHDFRKRHLGEEIVRALTVAPEGAPDWATDPAQLWNRAEASERRKDAQVARDYRIPIPFGLSDQQAGDMAERMARFIAEELSTAVSLGLHRDGELDALGVPKPPEKQGYHAHLYFPTRKLASLEEGGGESASGTGMGSKLIMLSNKRTSADFVERLNAQWAKLANAFTAAHDLPADYSHLSYARQGLPITPQPTLGQTVTAMERRGFFTRRGNALRDIVLPSAEYEDLHAGEVGDQRERAVMDVVREAARQFVAVGPNTIDTNGPEHKQVVSDVPAGWAPAPPQPPLPEQASLMARFEAALPIVPVTPEAREGLFSLLKFVQAIERALRALSNLAGKLLRHEEDTGRRMTAKLDTDYELDLARRARAAADQELRQWEAEHPWRMLKSRTLNGGTEVDHPEWRALTVEVQRRDRHVQELKATIQSHRASLVDLGEQEASLLTMRARSKEQLTRAVEGLVALGPTHGPTLLAVAPEGQRGWLEVVLASTMPDVASGSSIREEVPPVLDLAPPRLRPSPQRRAP